LALEIRRIAGGRRKPHGDQSPRGRRNKPYNTDFVKTLWRFTPSKAGFNSRFYRLLDLKSVLNYSAGIKYKTSIQTCVFLSLNFSLPLCPRGKCGEGFLIGRADVLGQIVGIKPFEFDNLRFLRFNLPRKVLTDKINLNDLHLITARKRMRHPPAREDTEQFQLICD